MANSKDSEWANMVVLAGKVKTVKLQDDNAFFLIDVTGEKEGPTKWIPCTIYKDAALLNRMDSYREGDAIKIRGYVRAWSQKKDGEWKNAVDIRVTEIKGPDPKRETKKREESRGREPGEDDDISSRW